MGFDQFGIWRFFVVNETYSSRSTDHPKFVFTWVTRLGKRIVKISQGMDYFLVKVWIISMIHLKDEVGCDWFGD